MRLSLYDQRLRFAWLPEFFADFCAVVVAYAMTFFLRFRSEFGEDLFEAVPILLGAQPGMPGEPLEYFYLASAFRLTLILAAVLCTLYALGNLYDRRRYLLEHPIAWDVIVANAVALGLFYSYWYLRRNVHHPRSFFASFILLNIFFCIVFRRFVAFGMDVLRRHYCFDVCRTVLAGKGEHAELIGSLLKRYQPQGIKIADRVLTQGGHQFDSDLDHLRTAIKKDRPDLLIYDCYDCSVAQIMRLLELTQDVHIPVKILSPELGVLVSRSSLPCDMLRGVPLVHFDAPPVRGGTVKRRRWFSLLVASAALLAAAPFMALIALMIRITSRGPVIFIQERMGVNRIPFNLYKFRTMHDQAEQALAEIEELNESDGALFKMKNDPRVTPVGRFLRRFSLDELPQLYNVLKGDMEIVGPRPLPRRDFENYFEQWHYSRHSGLPGLTCLWQISGRSHVSFHNMCIMDVYYLRNRNWILDFKIVLKTVQVVLFGEGAY